MNRPSPYLRYLPTYTRALAGINTCTNSVSAKSFSYIMSKTDPPTAQQPSAQQTFTLLLFASASTYAGDIESLQLSAPLPLSGLFAELEERFPGIRKRVLYSCAVSVNLEYVDVPADDETGGFVIQAGDEVGIIPPVSSG